MTVRVGFVGAGNAVRDLHVPALARLGPAVEVTAVAAGQPAHADALAGILRADYGWPAQGMTLESLMASDAVDAVVVAVPIALTSATTAAAIGAGKHVLAEKPLACSTADALALVAAADAAGVVLAVGENVRFQPDYAAVHELVCEGVIGEPKACVLNDLHFTAPSAPYARSAWRRAGSHRGGYVFDGGPHRLSALRAMVGTDVLTVHAIATAFHPNYLTPPDTLFLNIEFEGGVAGHVALGYGSVDREGRHPKIYGTEGTIAVLQDAIELWTPDSVTRLCERDTRPGFVEQWTHFLGCVRGELDPNPLLYEAVVDVALLDAGLRSADEGRVVRLEELLG